MHLFLFFQSTLVLLGLFHVAHCEQAMTTVLARPLGGYGLTPLIFEPSPSSSSSFGSLLGLGSSQLETKVRKSPVYELIMPNYDDEALSTGFALEPPPPPLPAPLPVKSSKPSKTKAAPKKSFDYESLISSKQSLSAAADRAALVSALPSTNSYYSTATSGMLGSNVLFGSSKSLHSSQSNSYYNEPMPSYKESISRSDNFGGGGGGGGSKSGGYSSGSYGGSSGGGGGGLNAAIQSVRSVEVKDVQNMYENDEQQVIDIPPSGLPIIINFRTSSSQIQIHQTHEGAEPIVSEPTKSEDEPSILRHEVTKPIIQEVREIIVPYRKILQEIRPVQEEVKTIVARGKPRDQQHHGKQRGGGGGKYGGGHKSSGGGGGLGGDINLSTSKSYKS